MTWGELGWEIITSRSILCFHIPSWGMISILSVSILIFAVSKPRSDSLCKHVHIIFNVITHIFNVITIQCNYMSHIQWGQMGSLTLNVAYSLNIIRPKSCTKCCILFDSNNPWITLLGHLSTYSFCKSLWKKLHLKVKCAN